jgi:hypothetical protein
VAADFGPRPQHVGLAQRSKSAHGAQADGATRTCPWRGHRARDARGGTRSGGSPMTLGQRDLQHEYAEVEERVPGNSNEAETHRDGVALVRRRTVVARWWFFHGGGAPTVFSGDTEVLEHRWMERSELAATNRGKNQVQANHIVKGD